MLALGGLLFQPKMKGTTQDICSGQINRINTRRCRLSHGGRGRMLDCVSPYTYTTLTPAHRYVGRPNYHCGPGKNTK